MVSLRPFWTSINVGPNLKQNYLACDFPFVESVKAFIYFFQPYGVSE